MALVMKCPHCRSTLGVYGSGKGTFKCPRCDRYSQLTASGLSLVPEPPPPPPTEYAYRRSSSSEPYLPISLVIMLAFLLGLAAGLALSVG